MLDLKLWPATTDFTVGLYVGFKNANDAALYAEHPQHVQFVNDWWARVLLNQLVYWTFMGSDCFVLSPVQLVIVTRTVPRHL
jgi:hypothetical protein